jgi:hypothetical protein
LKGGKYLLPCRVCLVLGYIRQERPGWVCRQSTHTTHTLLLLTVMIIMT